MLAHGRRVLLASFPLALLAACDGPNGFGRVVARFTSDECPAGTKRGLTDYEFEADYLATERFGGALLIGIQKHRVNVEETDGLAILINLDACLDQGRLVIDRGRGQIVRADSSQSLDLRTSTVPPDANAALSLFQTCPEVPTNHAIGGVLELTKLTISERPEQTGEGERVAGTLTATIAREDLDGPAGTLEASFDFAPPRRPLTDFK
jgi:hypothetical protein